MLQIEEVRRVEISKKEIESIIVTNSDNEVIAVITDDEIIEKEGYKVILEPLDEDEKLEKKIEKFDKAAIHWVFTMTVSAITALITTLALLKK